MTGGRAGWIVAVASTAALVCLAGWLVTASALPVTTVVLLALLVGLMRIGFRCVAAVAEDDPARDGTGILGRLCCPRIGSPGTPV
ncbi:hypothetical protein [Geodermatophilus sp. CPCC 206100]|uniref:hypothetical protein n=1 Tax=Geodermatophilus sp. CPCC 206100 TaxID=3020054 RepID=UPI003B006255